MNRRNFILATGDGNAGESMPQEYEFDLELSGMSSELNPDMLDSMFGETCQDATFFSRDGKVSAWFCRIADSLEAAIASATADIEKAGAKVVRVIPAEPTPEYWRQSERLYGIKVDGGWLRTFDGPPFCTVSRAYAEAYATILREKVILDRPEFQTVAVFPFDEETP